MQFKNVGANNTCCKYLVSILVQIDYTHVFVYYNPSTMYTRDVNFVFVLAKYTISPVGYVMSGASGTKLIDHV